MISVEYHPFITILLDVFYRDIFLPSSDDLSIYDEIVDSFIERDSETRFCNAEMIDFIMELGEAVQREIINEAGVFRHHNLDDIASLYEDGVELFIQYVAYELFAFSFQNRYPRNIVIRDIIIYNSE